MSLNLELVNRRALVSGGTKGIGAAIVGTLRDAGARVIAVARSIPATRTEGVHYLSVDLSTAEGARVAGRSVLERLGGIDILVNVLGARVRPAVDSPRSTTRSGRRS